MIFRPMKAPSEIPTLEQIKLPKYASPKLDGFRATVKDGILYSSTMKPIRNKYTQSLFGKEEHNDFDGELIVGDPTAPDCFNRTQSGVTALEGEPGVTFYVFDRYMEDIPFSKRFASFWSLPMASLRRPISEKVVRVQQEFIRRQEDLITYEQAMLQAGYEGIMLRCPDGKYKLGRATIKENTLLKRKPFIDSEAEIIGVVEATRNTNPAEINELGLTKRSSRKEGKIPSGTLGGFKVQDIYGGELFNCGPGVLTDDKLKAMWEDKESLIGKIITYKHMPGGAKDSPRFPQFKSFRDKDDITKY